MQCLRLLKILMNTDKPINLRRNGTDTYTEYGLLYFIGVSINSIHLGYNMYAEKIHTNAQFCGSITSTSLYMYVLSGNVGLMCKTKSPEADLSL